MTERAGALLALQRTNMPLAHVKPLLADSAYTGLKRPKAVSQALGKPVSVAIAKQNELHRFKVLPKRWIVERTVA